jgi:hypothetical protein
MNRETEIEKAFRPGQETLSELRRLSRDPELTRQPDPNFDVRFRDPDELGEEEATKLVPRPVTQACRPVPATTGWCGRRSPKE